MKAVQLAALLGGIVSALAAPDGFRRDGLFPHAPEAYTTTTLFTTSFYTVTECVTSSVTCSHEATTVLTTVVATTATTTTCPVVSTPAIPGTPPPGPALPGISVPGTMPPGSSPPGSTEALTESTTDMGIPTGSASGPQPTDSAAPYLPSTASSAPGATIISCVLPSTAINSLSSVASGSITFGVPPTQTVSVAPGYSTANPSSSSNSTDVGAVPTSFGSSPSGYPTEPPDYSTGAPGYSTGAPGYSTELEGTNTGTVPTPSAPMSSGYRPSSPGSATNPQGTNTSQAPTPSAPLSSGNQPSIPGYSTIPEGTNTNTAPSSSVPISGVSQPAVPGYSTIPEGTYTSTIATPPRLASSGYATPSSQGASSSGPTGTITGSMNSTYTPVSSAPGLSGSSTVRGYPTIPASYPTGSYSNIPGAPIPASSNTGSTTFPTQSSGSPYPSGPTTGYDTGSSMEGTSTTYVTSILTHPLTTVVTVPTGGSGSSTMGAVPTDIGIGASGPSSQSGYPIPSGGNNTVISPTPTYSVVPINLGQQLIGAGKSSMVAIVVAFTFAHFV